MPEATESAPNGEPVASKRRSTRVVQAVPLTITGVDALGRPFQERTSTLIVNCHGCRYQSKHYVLKNMWVTLEVPHPDPGRAPRSVRAKIVWIQRPRTVRELFQLAVELEVPGNIWGIAFPPEDWFPFPDTSAREMPAPEAEVPAPAPEPESPGVEAAEGNVRVLPGFGPAEASLTLARHVARLMVEARQQMDAAVREAAVKAVAAETQPLLAAIQNQFTEAAERSVKSATTAHTEQMLRQTVAKIDDARQTGLESLREKWDQEIQRLVQEASPQLAAHLAEISRAHQASFEQQLEAHLNQALERVNQLTSQISGSVESAQAGVARLRQQMDESAEEARRRWQELVEGPAGEASARLERLQQAARQLNEEINSTTSTARMGWRARFEADLAAAGIRWQEKIEGSLSSASQQATEHLARDSQAVTNQLEQEFSQRTAAIRQSFEQAAAQTESALGELRAALAQEIARAQVSLAESREAASSLERYPARLEEMARATTEKLQQDFEGVLQAQSSELNRRAESAIAGMAERFEPVLEAAGEQTVAGLAAQLEERLTPHLDRASELVEKLATGQGQAEETLRTNVQRLLETSGKAAQQSEDRLKETAGRFEKELEEAGRAATLKWLAELEARASDSSHTTFEALYKASEWYEKKVQTQMQAQLDKGLEQASNSLREKAGEISSLLASELDHYSRTYVEHTRGQVEEGSREIVERVRGQLAQAAETTSATFGDETHRTAQREYERFTASIGNAFAQTAQQLDAHAAQVRSRIDAEARQFFVEFHKGMTQEIEQGFTQARQELEAQVAPMKDAWRAQREAQEHQLKEALAHLGDQSIEAYKKRLENASNSWLVASVTTLSRQSQDLIGILATSAEKRLRETCSEVFADVGENLRQRLLNLLGQLPGSTPPAKEK